MDPRSAGRGRDADPNSLFIGKCHATTAQDRFGPEADNVIRQRERVLSFQATPEILPTGEPLIWPVIGKDLDDDAKHPHSLYRLIPTPQGYRNNLTALSDIYNLYFVAYQNRVFVYQLHRGGQSTVHRHPDLQLRARMSPEAGVVGGYVDAQEEAHGRSINHMIVGFLGTDEILLHSADNGDVVAYYTKDIASHIFGKRPATATCNTGLPLRRRISFERQRGALGLPQPFFAASVFNTAWGLAIHPKSQLIAVTTNRAEVTVFAFAVAPRQSSKAQEDRQREPKEDVEAWVRQRRRNWRIVIKLPRRASNLPNLCFLESDKGLAENVCAVDINGSLWIAEIWKPQQAVTWIPRNGDSDFISQEFPRQPSRGWGVLGLRDSHFMAVDTVEELLGAAAHVYDFKQPMPVPVELPKHELAMPTLRVDLSPGLETLRDSPCRPSRSAGNQVHPRFAVVANIAGPDNDDEDEPGQAAGEEAEEDDSEGLLDWLDEESEEDEEEDEDMDSAEDDEQDNDDVDEATTNAPPAGTEGGAAPAAPNPLINNPPPPPHNPALLAVPFQETFTTLAEAVEVMNEAFNGIAAQLTWNHGGAPKAKVEPPRHVKVPKAEPSEASSCTADPPLLDMIYYPHNGQTEQAPAGTPARVRYCTALRRMREDVKTKRGEASDGLAREYRLLRTYEKDFEMVDLSQDKMRDSREIGVFCSNAICCESLTRPAFHATSRLSMLAHIPELSVVILGSPTGRVMVATLTRLRTPEAYLNTRWKWDRGIRIECVLPRESDEALYRPRDQVRPLFGVAFGRVPQVGDGSGQDGRGSVLLPRRYRIMLHYRNHLILSYEMSRVGEGRKLCFF